MKKLFFLATVALGMTAACQKPDVKVEEPEIDDNAPVEVKFGVNAPTLTVTKTKAAVDEWENTKIYIYSGVVTTDETSGSSSISFLEPLINNDVATINNATDGTVTFNDNKVFYYDVNAVYDFYGYYIDEIQPETPAAVSSEGTTITVAIKIDGSQDVMLAKTNHAEDMAKTSTAVNASRIYSAYTARRGVQPTLNFEHMLSRFVFNVKQGNSVNKDKNQVQDVYVSAISLESEETGILTIAPTQAFNATGEKKDLTSVINHSNDVTLTTHPDRKYFKPTDNFTQAGSDLMIFPTNSDINLLVTLTPANEADNDTPKTYPMPVTLKPSMFKEGADAFIKGQKYIVNLTVYGLEQITLSAKLAEWGEGGQATYDPDDDYAENEVYAIKATNSSNTEVILYSKAALANDVTVYSDVKCETPATEDNYSTSTHTFTVGNNGTVSSYNEKTQTGA